MGLVFHTPGTNVSLDFRPHSEMTLHTWPYSG
ncbi:hypothetical protein CEXT_32161, partial [Caerostris extrusa]